MNAHLIARLTEYRKLNFGAGSPVGAGLMQQAIEALETADARDEHHRDRLMSASAELELFLTGNSGSAARALLYIREALEAAP